MAHAFFLIFVADPRTGRLYIFDSSVPQLHGKQAVSGFDIECKDTALGSAVTARRSMVISDAVSGVGGIWSERDQ
jgi:hypothetical protein